MLPALFLPWAPLLLLVPRRALFGDARARFLLAWTLFGLVFLSASINKLPGYVLPLLPAIAALTAIALHAAPRAGWMLTACAALLAAFPIAAPIFPAAAANEWASAPHLRFHWTWLLALLPAAAVWILDGRGKRLAAVATVAVGTAAGVVYLKIAVEPEVDRRATARALTAEAARHPGEVCLENLRREWEYGLKYYAVPELPQCEDNPKRFRLIQPPGQSPQLVSQGSGGTGPPPGTVDPR